MDKEKISMRFLRSSNLMPISMSFYMKKIMDLLVRNQSTMRHLSVKDMILERPCPIMSLILMSLKMVMRMNFKVVSEAEVALLGHNKIRRGKEVESLWLNTTSLVFQLVKKPLSCLHILVF